jgi:integrase
MANDSKDTLDQNESNNPSLKSNKKRKRGQGEGTIYKRKDGRWAAVINLGYLNGKLRRKTFYGDTREVVKDKLIAALRDQQQGLPIGIERQTVKQFLERWLSDCAKPSVRPKTFVSYSQLVRIHIIPELGRIQIAKLSPQQVQAFMNGRLSKGLSPRTVQYLRAVLRRALGQALKWGLVARNVATLVDSPRVERPEIKPMHQPEAKVFLEAIQGDRLEALFSVALAMGLRQGEALALRWSDIDWDARLMRVRFTLQRINKKLELAELKTKNSRRDLPLIETIIAGLRMHRSRQLQEKMLAGSRWQETGFVFTTTIGTPLDARNVVRKYHALLKKAGLSLHRFHDLRHSCASLLLAKGVPLKTVSDILGHSQLSITADFYAHVIPEMRREAMRVMDSVLSGR